MDYRKIPKVELHVHLDGSVRIDTVQELTGKTREEISHLVIAPEKCQDLNDYLTKFDLPIHVLQTKENLTRVAYELGMDLKLDGVVYAEVRFAPLKHIKNGLTKEEVIEAVLKGFHTVPEFEFGLILCMMRDMNEKENTKVIELAKKYRGNGVVGIDLAGAEAVFKTNLFKNLFELAKKEDIPFTIHAGEADGADSVFSAIQFGAKRIGHGIRMLENMDLVKVAQENNILLEVCPTSNVQTNAVDSYMSHPIKKLYDLGCLVSVNTDNRTVSNITLTREYEILSQYHNFTVEDYIKMNCNAMEFSFAPPDIRKKIISKINAYKNKKI